jgi:6,7-dimethyl-8-ribityllumazine synthase
VTSKRKQWGNADLYLTVSDPDSAFELVRSRKWEIHQDHSGPEQSHLARSFSFKLPGGTQVTVLGPLVTEGVADADHLVLEGSMLAAGKRFAVVVSRFNSFITERLLAGTLDGLVRSGAKFEKDIAIVRVPGAFEIPSAARTLAESRKYDAIVCIGCLLRGDTAHYDVIVNEVTRGVGQSAQETGVPHAFGVLTCDTLEQAIDRAGLKWVIRDSSGVGSRGDGKSEKSGGWSLVASRWEQQSQDSKVQKKALKAPVDSSEPLHCHQLARGQRLTISDQMGTRRKSRELVLQMLFQADMGRQSGDDVRRTFWRERDSVEPDVRGFAEDLFRVAWIAPARSIH